MLPRGQADRMRLGAARQVWVGPVLSRTLGCSSALCVALRRQPIRRESGSTGRMPSHPAHRQSQIHRQRARLRPQRHNPIVDPVPKKLLVLDLDETLVHATESRLERAEDFRVGPYFVYRRPHLAMFIDAVAREFDLGVWTASGENYAAQVIDRVFPAGILRFVWSSRRCTTARDWTTGHYTTVKNLRKLKKQGYRLEQIIAIDDTPSKYGRSYGNLVVVREFVGSPDDSELLHLARYLRSLASAPNVRTIEKRNWRSEVTRETDPSVGALGDGAAGPCRI